MRRIARGGVPGRPIASAGTTKSGSKPDPGAPSPADDKAARTSPGDGIL